MPWVRIDDKLHDNDKLGAVSDAAFRLYILALSWSNDKLTDGHIPTPRPIKLLTMRKPDATVRELLDARLWHRAASPCRTCVEQRAEKQADDIPSGGYVIHDYFTFQKPAWMIREGRELRSVAGRIGAAARWPDSKPHGKSDSKPHGKSDSKSHSAGDANIGAFRAPIADPRTPAGADGKRYALGVKAHGKPDAPVSPRTQGSLEPRTSVPAGEPPIPDDPVARRSNDRRGTGLRPIGDAIRRTGGGAR